MLKLNPFKILLIWLVISVSISLSTILGNSEASGGEQIPLTAIANFPHLFIVGAFMVTIFSLLYYRAWLGSNKWFYALSLIIIIAGMLLLKQNNSIEYSFTEKSDTINGINIISKTEYYNQDEKVIRSSQFFKNGRKDSIWKTYSRKGDVIEIQMFRNDTLISEK